MIKILIGCVCIGCMFLDRVCFTYDSDLHSHLVFCFFHANVFHLLGNLLCLYLIKIGWGWFIWCYILNLISSYLPCPVWDNGFVYMESCGLSGVLMGCVGVLWGKAFFFLEGRKWLLMVLKWAVLPVIVTGFIPKMNFMMHVWCFAFGLISGIVYEGRRRYIKVSR